MEQQATRERSSKRYIVHPNNITQLNLCSKACVKLTEDVSPINYEPIMIDEFHNLNDEIGRLGDPYDGEVNRSLSSLPTKEQPKDAVDPSELIRAADKLTKFSNKETKSPNFTSGASRTKVYPTEYNVAESLAYFTKTHDCRTKEKEVVSILTNLCSNHWKDIIHPFEEPCIGENQPMHDNDLDEMNKKSSKMTVTVYKPFFHKILKAYKNTVKNTNDNHLRNRRKYHYSSHPKSSIYRARAAVMTRKSSINSIQTIEPLLQKAFCLDNGIKYPNKRVRSQACSASTYRRLIRKNTGLTIYQAVKLLKLNPFVYITCDKGSSEKKCQENSLFPKILTWFNPRTEEIEELMLDVDRAGGETECAADAIIHSLDRLVKMTGCTLKLTIMGVYTDSGGGGTLEPLLNELAKRLEDNEHIKVHVNATFFPARFTTYNHV